MIYDRTIADVEAARAVQQTKVYNAFSELTQEDIDILERGMLTVNVLNRIEAKQEELKQTLNDMGYWGFTCTNRQWARGDYFKHADLARLCRNATVLRESFISVSKDLNNPVPVAHFEELNRLERLLAAIAQLAADVIARYLICGTVVCGGKEASSVLGAAKLGALILM